MFPLVLFAVLLMACASGEDPLPSGPPVALAYEAACDSTNHQRLVILEGYFNLFPRLLACYPDEDARTGRSCQVKLMPAVDASTVTADDERAYLTVFIDEGERPNEARSRGYGFGAPLKVFTSDSTEIDPYDRVRISGRMHAREEIGRSDGLLCTLDAASIEMAARAEISWADEQQADREALQARLDSLNSLRGERDSLQSD